jgi:excisionase family DNA binding protein
MYCSHGCNSAAFKQKVRTRRVKQSNKETQRLKNQRFEELKAKVFMSITDTCKLIGISRRTVFRMIELGDLITAQSGKRTIISRSVLEQLLFKQP